MIVLHRLCYLLVALLKERPLWLMQIIISNRVSYRLETARCLRKRSAFFCTTDKTLSIVVTKFSYSFIHSFIHLFCPECTKATVTANKQ